MLHVNYARVRLTRHNRILPRCATYFARSWDQVSNRCRQYRLLSLVSFFTGSHVMIHDSMHLMSYGIDGWIYDRLHTYIHTLYYTYIMSIDATWFFAGETIGLLIKSTLVQILNNNIIFWYCKYLRKNNIKMMYYNEKNLYFMKKIQFILCIIYNMKLINWYVIEFFKKIDLFLILWSFL